MDLEKLIVEYSEKMKSEILETIERHPFNYHLFLHFKEERIIGFGKFAEYLVADFICKDMESGRSLNAPSIEKMNAAINEVTGYVHYIEPKYELLSDYMSNKFTYNEMKSILQAPSDEQSSFLDFFENNLHEAEQKMKELKSKIDFFDWCKEEEYYSNWVSDFSNYCEKAHERNCCQDFEPEM